MELEQDRHPGHGNDAGSVYESSALSADAGVPPLMPFSEWALDSTGRRDREQSDSGDDLVP